MDYLEAARLDGASEWQLFWRVTMPLLRPVSYVTLSLWVISATQLFGLVQALKGPGLPRELETLATYQYAIAFNARDNLYMMGRGAAMAVTLVAIVAILVGLLRLLLGRKASEY